MVQNTLYFPVTHIQKDRYKNIGNQVLITLQHNITQLGGKSVRNSSLKTNNCGFGLSKVFLRRHT